MTATIRVFPDHGHPSSLWPSKELLIVNRPMQPYVLPNEIGIDDVLGERILTWTDRFQNFFVKKIDDFTSRPHWRPGTSVYDWYDEGYRIVLALRVQFPDVAIKPEFAQYVFSVNERRENAGLPPISLEREPELGHIDISALPRPPQPDSGA